MSSDYVYTAINFRLSTNEKNAWESLKIEHSISKRKFSLKINKTDQIKSANYFFLRKFRHFIKKITTSIVIAINATLWLSFYQIINYCKLWVNQSIPGNHLSQSKFKRKKIYGNHQWICFDGPEKIVQIHLRRMIKSIIIIIYLDMNNVWYPTF